MSIQHFFGSKFPAFLNQSFHILGQERVESPHHQVTLRLDLSQIPGGKIVRFQKPKIRANTKMRIKKLVKLGRKSCETIENPLFRKEYSQPWSSSLCTSIHTINHHPIFLFDLQYLHFQIALKYNLNNICFHQTCLAASPKFHWPHLQLKSPKSGPSQINAFNLGLPTYPQFWTWHSP